MYTQISREYEVSGYNKMFMELRVNVDIFQSNATSVMRATYIDDNHDEWVIINWVQVKGKTPQEYWIDDEVAGALGIQDDDKFLDELYQWYQEAFYHFIGYCDKVTLYNA